MVTGHAAVYGWDLAMFEALDQTCAPGAAAATCNKEWVASLWQAALTLTLQGHLVQGVENLAVLSMQKNSDLILGSKLMADSFPAFARKLAVAMQGVSGVQKRMGRCQNLKISFNVSSVSRTLLLAAGMYMERLDDETHAVLVRMERMFGKEAFTAKYNNVCRVLQLCGKRRGGTVPRRLASCDMWHTS